MAFDVGELNGYIDEAAELGPDMNESSGGGFEQRELAPGFCKLRLVGYVELGIHKDTVNGVTKSKDMVRLEFEVTGPKHPVPEGEKPSIIAFKLSKSLNEKAHYYKMFKRLNHDGSAKHFAQLLGKAFKGTIHVVVKGEGSDKKTYYNLRDANGFTIAPAYSDDPDTGESVPIKVEPQVNATRCFIWDAPKGLDKMWESLFIDGVHEAKDGKEPVSKNWIQETVRRSINFKGSPIEGLIGGGQALEELGGAEPTTRTEADVEKSRDAKAGASADPLEDM